MRVLIDESLPVELVAHLAPVEARTVRQQRWLGLRNGVLLRAAVAAGFDVFVTADKDLPFQQNLRALGIAVVVVGSRNRIDDVLPLIPQIVDAIARLERGEWITIGQPRTDSIADRAAALVELATAG